MTDATQIPGDELIQSASTVLEWAERGGPSREYQDPLFGYWEKRRGDRIESRNGIPTWEQNIPRRGKGQMPGPMMMDLQRRFTTIRMSMERALRRGDEVTADANNDQARKLYDLKMTEYPGDRFTMKAAYRAAMENAKDILDGKMDEGGKRNANETPGRSNESSKGNRRE